MSAKKLAITALLAAAFFSQSAIAAMAEDSGGSDTGGSVSSPSGQPSAPPQFDRKHGDGKQGDHKDHQDGQFQVAVPPMVITPNNDVDDSAGNTKTGGAGIKQGFKVAPPKGGSGVNASVPDTAGKEQVIEPNSAAFDPTANQPIQMQNVHPSSKTPADVFIQSAQIGVGAMAAGAAVLGIAAAARGQRSRRESKTDFIYEAEN